MKELYQLCFLCFPFVDLLLYDGIDDGDGRQVQDVACRALHVGEVNWLVQTHLDRADGLGES